MAAIRKSIASPRRLHPKNGIQYIRTHIVLLATLSILAVLFLLIMGFFLPSSPISTAMANLSTAEHGDLYFRYFPTKEDYKIKSRPVILMWTLPSDQNYSVDWESGKTFLSQRKCQVHNCIVTYDHSHYKSADAIIIHYTAFIKGQSVLPPYRLPYQRYVFYNKEAPSHRLFKTSIKMYFNNVFNWSSTYRSDADAPAKYFKTVRSSIKSKVSYQKIIKGKKPGKRLAFWFVSHCRTDSKREEYVKELQKYIDVDVYGKCGNLTCQGISFSCFKDKNFTAYWFYLSFENAICPDYATEKVTLPLMVGRHVPVVLGGADYQKILPPHSYINVMDFITPKALADYLIQLTNQPRDYLKYFTWREKYKVVFHPGPWCEICRLLNDSSEKWKVVRNFSSWWGRNQCDAGWFKRQRSFW